jgi:hypothetical protein
MSYHFKSLAITTNGSVLANTSNLSSDYILFEFLKFMTSSPANGGPGWTMKSYGYGRNDADGTPKSFQLNGNFDPLTIFSGGTDYKQANSFASSGRWFILQEPALNRNYRREFLFQSGEATTPYQAAQQNFTIIWYSAQGFLTTATGNGFSNSDVSGYNPPIAYDMMTVSCNGMRNPNEQNWNRLNPATYYKAYLSGAGTIPMTYMFCAADNSNGEGYGWYIAAHLRPTLQPVRFICYDPMLSGTYDSSITDPTIHHNTVSGNFWGNGAYSSLFGNQDGGFLYNANWQYADTLHSQQSNIYTWAKRPLTFTSKTDLANKVSATENYAAQVCRVLTAQNGRNASVPWAANNVPQCLPYPFTHYAYPNNSGYFWLGNSSMMKMSLQNNLQSMQTVNLSTLRDHIHFCGTAERILLPWDGSVPAMY